MVALLIGRPLGAAATPDISILDLLELDMGYTTVTDNYYRSVKPQALLDGARAGLVAYLHGRGIRDPQIPMMHARRDGRGVVPAIERQLAQAITTYGSRVDARGLVYGAIRGELGSLHDPYSVFFTKSELAGFTTAINGTVFGGIGIVLTADAAGQYRAAEVFDETPAARAGVVAGDRILAVDGVAIDGLRSERVSALLRGPIGTPVQLTTLSAPAGESQQVHLIRAAISPPEVSARLLTGNVAYVALRGFGPTAGPQVRAALTRLRAQGAVATVFDLRGNGGGYESSAVRVASVFIPSGAVVVTQTKQGRRRVTSTVGRALAVAPLALLVDRDSASASELVSVAIQDHALGKIVGTRTFGKGLVQTMFPLPDGSALKVTTARYFSPRGRDIDRIGVTPDVVVEQPPGSRRGVPGYDPQLDAALKILTL